MEIRLKINMGGHSSRSRQLSLSVLSLAAAKEDAQGRAEKLGKYRVIISLEVLLASTDCFLGAIWARSSFHEFSKHYRFLFCEFMWTAHWTCELLASTVSCGTDFCSVTVPWVKNHILFLVLNPLNVYFSSCPWVSLCSARNQSPVPLLHAIQDFLGDSQHDWSGSTNAVTRSHTTLMLTCIGKWEWPRNVCQHCTTDHPSYSWLSMCLGTILAYCN